jgi:hypothetical protein
MTPKQKLVSKKRLRKALRYVLMFLVLFVACQYIPECTNYKTSFIIATIACVAFTIIDMHFPVLCE